MSICYGSSDIVSRVVVICSIFRAKKRALLLHDISRHKAPIKFSNAASERADDFVPPACQRFCQFAETMPLKRFLKGEKSILESDVFVLKKDQLDDVIR